MGRYQVLEYRTRDGEVVYSAWEPYTDHGTVFHNGDEAYGELMSRPLPAELDALPPRSEARIHAVQAWREALRQEAYEAIVALRPAAAAGERLDGEIWLKPGRAES